MSLPLDYIIISVVKSLGSVLAVTMTFIKGPTTMSCKITVFSALRRQLYWQRRWDSNPHAFKHRSQIPACISNFITPLYFGASRGIRTLNPAGRGFSYHYIISAKISIFCLWSGLSLYHVKFQNFI